MQPSYCTIGLHGLHVIFNDNARFQVQVHKCQPVLYRAFVNQAINQIGRLFPPPFESDTVTDGNIEIDHSESIMVGIVTEKSIKFTCKQLLVAALK